jgi:hypothetical protein
MMNPTRFDLLTAQAATVGARINRTGDGAFIILYRGQRYLVVNLNAAGAVLTQMCAGAAA